MGEKVLGNEAVYPKEELSTTILGPAYTVYADFIKKENDTLGHGCRPKGFIPLGRNLTSNLSCHI